MGVSAFKREEEILSQAAAATVSVVMGSQSDWSTMLHAVETLKKFGLNCETRVVSAHRTPQLLTLYAQKAEERGLALIIAGAGGAAHLPGMLAAQTTLPVLGVPIKSRSLQGVDSLLSIVQMPAGVPTATFAIGEAGAINAALFALRLLALHNKELARKLVQFNEQQRVSVLEQELSQA